MSKISVFLSTQILFLICNSPLSSNVSQLCLLHLKALINLEPKHCVVLNQRYKIHTVQKMSFVFAFIPQETWYSQQGELVGAVKSYYFKLFPLPLCTFGDLDENFTPKKKC